MNSFGVDGSIRQLIAGIDHTLDETTLNMTGKRFEVIKERGQSKRRNMRFKPISVIVYPDGILFTGESKKMFAPIVRIFKGAEEGEKEWKQLLFEDMLSMKLFPDRLEIVMKYQVDNKNYLCNLQKNDPKEWESFICYVYTTLKDNSKNNSNKFLNLRNEFKDDTKPKNYYRYSQFKCIRPISSPNMGGQRKTKRSKRSKKCKRRTRRS
jgi:hypothetical protein